MLEGRLARLHAVKELSPGSPARFLVLHHGQSAYGAGHPGLQGLSERGQRNMALLGLREDPIAGEGAQDAVEGMGMGTDQRGQLLIAFRPVFEEVSDAESGSNVE